MKSVIKTLDTSEVRTDKNGRKYRKVIVKITIGTIEFIETYYIYEKGKEG